MGARRIYLAQIDQTSILDAIIDLEEDDTTPFEGD